MRARGFLRAAVLIGALAAAAVVQGGPGASLFSPRMVHSGVELEKFPDAHLDEIAAAGMDSIIVYISDPPDMTRNGRADVNDLVRRAAKRGLSVYAYAHFCRKAAKLHPLDPGAREWYDQTYGAIVRNAPGLKGLVCVGESAAFPSRDEGMGGYWWQHDPQAKHMNGFWPSSDWVDWLKLVTEVTRRYNPDFEILFWTYNWFNAPEKNRLALLERIPTNVTLHVTYEMGPEIDDYSIKIPGPGKVFRSEAAVARRRGIRLTAMTNTGGRTWDFGGIPYVPTPFGWMRRFAALRESHEEYGLSGLMESHHYGFTPSLVSELSQVAFAKGKTMRDVERRLAEIAVRDFGAANTAAVFAAWRDWDEAMTYHVARDYDQWGPLRLGPTYPFTKPGEKLPLPADRVYWKYVHPVFSMPKSAIDPAIEQAARELACWKRGADRLEAILPTVPADRLDAARKLVGIGRYCEHTIRTSLNQKRHYRELLKAEPDRATVLAILADEEQNVRETLPYVEYDSRLGWEPSMLDVARPAQLRWKLDQLEQERRRLP